MKRSITEIPAVSIYSLPAHLLGKKLMPDQAIFRDIRLERSYPPCKEILDYLLQGITFAFDLNHAELEIIVKPTEDIPPVEESRNMLKRLFNTPIGTQIMIPEDVESALRKGLIPKASCYHPTKVSFSSPELYERMLTLIIARGVSRVLFATPDSHHGRIDKFFGKMVEPILARFLHKVI